MLVEVANVGAGACILCHRPTTIWYIAQNSGPIYCTFKSTGLLPYSCTAAVFYIFGEPSVLFRTRVLSCALRSEVRTVPRRPLVLESILFWLRGRSVQVWHTYYAVPVHA